MIFISILWIAAIILIIYSCLPLTKQLKFQEKTFRIIVAPFIWITKRIIKDKMAIVQFNDNINTPYYNKIVKLLVSIGGHWYVFSPEEERDWNISDLKQHYNLVLEVK
jgi:hypothetical protein